MVFQIFFYFLFIKQSLMADRLPVFDYHSTIPFLANGETSAFYPLNILLKYISISTFIKVNLFFHYCLGTVGLYLIFKKFNISFKLLPLAVIIALLNGNFYAHFYIGHYGWISYLLLPIYYAVYLNREKSYFYPLLMGAILSLVYYQGGQHIMIWFLILTAILVIYDIAEKRNFYSALKMILIIAASFSLLSAAKLIPSNFLYGQTYDQDSPVLGGFKYLQDAYYCLTNGCFSDTVGPNYPWVLKWWEKYSYVGQLPILIYLFYIFLPFKKRSAKERALLLTGILFLLFSINQVWYYLSHFSHSTVLISQRHPSRFIIMFIFSLSILVPLWLNNLIDKLKNPKVANVIITMVTLFVALDVLLIAHKDFTYNKNNFSAGELGSLYEESKQPIYTISDPKVVDISGTIGAYTNSLTFNIRATEEFTIYFPSLLIKQSKINLVAKDSHGNQYKQIDNNNNPALKLPAGEYGIKIWDTMYMSKWPFVVSFLPLLAFLIILLYKVSIIVKNRCRKEVSD